jgi:ATP-dependent Clp protease adapter protein ClpS
LDYTLAAANQLYHTGKATMLKVLGVNDDVTPMEFVVSILQGNFRQSREEAERVALQAHLNGDAVCGIYQGAADGHRSVSRATELSRRAGYRLCFLARPIPFWERAGGYIFGMVMKIAPNHR